MANSNTINKFNLQMHIEEEVFQNNPKFAQLLTILSGKLNKDGLTLVRQKEKEEVEAKLQLAMREWLSSQIPYHELREMITELEIESSQGTLSLPLEQLTNILSEATVFSELEDYLPLPSSPGIDANESLCNNVFGITLDDLDKHNHIKQHLPLIQKAVVPLLEERIVKKCQDLFFFFTLHDPKDPAVGDHNPLSLPMLVEMKKQMLKQRQATLDQVRQSKKESVLLYYQTLLDCLSLMERMISYNKLQVQAAADKTSLEWMEAWVNALATKIKMTMVNLESRVLSERGFRVMHIVRKHLEQKIRGISGQLNVTVQHLSAYREVGDEFKSLVAQYNILKRELDESHLGLEHFNPSASAPTD